MDDTVTFGFFLGPQNGAIAAKEAMAGQLVAIKVKYEEALELRQKAEMEIEAFRPVCYH